MKKYINASMVSAIVVFIVGIALPLATYLAVRPDINNVFFWVCLILLTVSIATIFTTMLNLIKYADTIDKLEESQSEVDKLKAELGRLVVIYNSKLAGVDAEKLSN